MEMHKADELMHNARKRMVGEVPPEANADPTGWAEKHIESLAPSAAKEMEYALKFGSDTGRYIAARDILAIKGLTTKPKETNLPPMAVTFNVNGPTAPSGAPILPFSNAAAKLPASQQTVTVDKSGPTVKDANDADMNDPARSTT